jgi:hypothetical protein
MSMPGGDLINSVVNTGMGVAHDAIGSPSYWVGMKQARYNYGLYAGAGGATLQNTIAQMGQASPYGSTGEMGYSTIAQMFQQSGYGSPANKMAQLGNYGSNLSGMTNEDAAGAYMGMQNSQTQAYSMAMGMGGTYDPITGKPLSTKEIAENAISAITAGRGFKDSRDLKNAMRPNAEIDSALAAAGYDPALMKPIISAVGRTQLEKGSQRVSNQDIMDVTGANDKENNPSALQSQLTLTKQDLNEKYVDAGYSGIAAGTEESMKYLANAKIMSEEWASGVFENLASMEGYMAGMSGTEGGATATLVSKIWNFLSGQSNAEGDWNVSRDLPTKVHAGEMILPSRVAESVRKDLKTGGKPTKGTPSDLSLESPSQSESTPSGGGGATYNVTIPITVHSASEAEATRVARKVKEILDMDQRMLTIGSGG